MTEAKRKEIYARYDAIKNVIFDEINNMDESCLELHQETHCAYCTRECPHADKRENLYNFLDRALITAGRLSERLLED